MRSADDMPKRRAPRRRRLSGRGRLVLLVVAGLLFVLFTSLRGAAGFYTDYLWFNSLNFSSVWRTIVGTRVMLAVVFTLTFAVITWVNLVIADRVAPADRRVGPEEDLLDRYREVVSRHAAWIRIAISLVFGLIAGVSMSSQWNSWILFRHGGDMGITDATFGADVGFYMFKLPFILSAIGWLFASLVFVLLITIVAHYLNGGIRLQGPGQRVTPQVKAHISVLLALLAAVKGLDYWFGRYELTFSSRGAVDGATYTDVQAQLPATYLLLLIAVLSCALFIANIWRRGWVLPVVAVGLWGIVVVLAGVAYPAFIQRFIVEPELSSREGPYIGNNITATRQGLALDDVEVQSFEYDSSRLGAVQAVRENQGTLSNVRLLDPKIVGPTYQNLQSTRGYYRFNDLDVDRYPIRRPDGSVEMTQVVLGNRDLDPGNAPGSSWEARHLAYTHGYGLALSAANATDPAGRPDFIVSDVPVEVNDERIDLSIDVPQLYFGENLGGYAVVGTNREEIDYLDSAGAPVPYHYEGTGGVALDNWFKRAAYFLRFDFEVNLLFSGFITPESRIIYGRDVKERVEAVAPFLSFDSDPYPVVDDGRVIYILDGYSTSDHYPNAQGADTSGLPPNSGLSSGSFNYVRNSVKAVVDAYDGSVKLYVVDESDPVVAAYREAFPDLFADADDLSPEVREHYRYPEDLFRVQTNMWGRYHLDDSQTFFDEANTWLVAQNPGTDVTTASSQVSQVVGSAGQLQPLQASRMDPYYVITRLPGETDENLVMLRSFVPFSRDYNRRQLTAFMVAKSNPSEYGKLVVYEMPSSLPADGPLVVNAAIQANEEISTRISLLDDTGSRVRYGDLLLVPINETILYVRPLYVESAGASPVPELKNVIVVWGNQIVMEPTLKEAIAKLFGVGVETFEQQTGQVEGEESPPPSGTTPIGPQLSGDAAALLAQAQQLFVEADAALRSGDLALYQSKIAEARAKIVEAQGLMDQPQGVEPTTTTTSPPQSQA